MWCSTTSTCTLLPLFPPASVFNNSSLAPQARHLSQIHKPSETCILNENMLDKKKTDGGQENGNQRRANYAVTVMLFLSLSHQGWNPLSSSDLQTPSMEKWLVESKTSVDERPVHDKRKGGGPKNGLSSSGPSSTTVVYVPLTFSSKLFQY